jgi:hypothetical protein
MLPPLPKGEAAKIVVPARARVEKATRRYV